MPMTNPFSEHAQNMEEYENMLSAPIAGGVGNFVTCALFTAAGAVAEKQYPATVGQFTVQGVLKDGGFSPRLMGQVIIRKSILPAGTYFKTGQKITATQAGGSVRACQVETIEDTFTEWRLNLWDVNEKA